MFSVWIRELAAKRDAQNMPRPEFFVGRLMTHFARSFAVRPLAQTTVRCIAVGLFSITLLQAAYAQATQTWSEPSDLPKNIDTLIRRAESGSLRDEYLVGWSYLNGYRVAKDVQKASYWLKRAAD